MDFNILVGGAAGQGVDTVAKALELILKNKVLRFFSIKIICPVSVADTTFIRYGLEIDNFFPS